MEDSLKKSIGNTKRSPTIGIIGGKGQIGGFFANLFLADNLNVLISDLDTDLSNIDLVHQSDIVIISVPIDTTISVIEEIVPYLSKDKLVIDMTSVKSLSSKALCLSKADVIGIHPMFNPSVGTIEHQTIILTPSRDRNGWLEKIKAYLTNKNVKIKVTTAEHHDHMMSLIQVLIHYNSISIGITMAKMGFDIHETLEYTSPIYRMELAMIGRIFAQNGRLYGNIPMHNPYTQKTILEHKLTLEEMSKIILTKDLDAFTEKFSMASDFFNDFKAKAMVESNYLIKQLVKYGEN